MTPETLPALIPTPAPVPAPIAGRAAAGDDLLEDFFASLKPSTLVAYQKDLRHFARWFAAARPEAEQAPAAAVGRLLAMTGGDANRIVLAYRNAMTGAGLSTATIARRLAALRSCVKLARTVGAVSWSIEIKAANVEPRRDVRGPDEADQRKLWKHLDGLGDTLKGRRDRALFALMLHLALRRAEVCSLDLASVDLAGGSLSVLRKGKTERVRVTLPDETAAALSDWLFVRGHAPGALFTALDRGRSAVPGRRLSPHGLRWVVSSAGRRAKARRAVRPHGLRHSSITAALDAGCDTRAVSKFAGHLTPNMIERYDDDRRDVAGMVARKVARKRK